MADVNKKKLLDEIHAKIYNNNQVIGLIHAEDMQKCLDGEDMMKLAVFCSLSFLSAFTDNTNEELTIGLAAVFNGMRENIEKKRNGEQG